MINLSLALLTFAAISTAAIFAAILDRSSRLAGTSNRFETQPPRSEWGNERVHAPAHYASARGLAIAARLVRSRTIVSDVSDPLRRSSRTLSLFATATALSIVPFGATWGGEEGGQALVAVNLEYGLGVLVFLVLISGLAQAATGLAERSLWARLGALRIAGQSLIGVALLLLVFAPLVLATTSLRPHDIVLAQQGTFAPFEFLGDQFFGLNSMGLNRFRLPNWFLLRQPLTAILIIPTLGILLQRYSVFDTMNNTAGMSGLGLDSDPSDLYWMGIEARLSSVLAVALFVAFFLGAGSIPYFDPSILMGKIEPILGEGFPAALLLLAEAGVFVAKMLFVLYWASILRRSTGRARTDQSLETMTRRLIPLAWANLLLASALSLLSAPSGGLL